MVARKKKSSKRSALKSPARSGRKSSKRVTLAQTTQGQTLSKIDSKLAKLETKLDELEARKDRLATKLDEIDTKFIIMETKADVAEVKLDQIEQKLDRRTGPPKRRLSVKPPQLQFEKTIHELSRLLARLPDPRIAPPQRHALGDTGAPTGPTTPTDTPAQIEKELDAFERELDLGGLIWMAIEQMVDMLEQFLDVSEPQWDEFEKTLDQHESQLDQPKRR